MVLGTAIDLRKTSMQQRAPADDIPPQVRAMQLENAAALQRIRQLEGEVSRLRTDLEASRSEVGSDFVAKLQGRIQELTRDLLQARNAEGAANKRVRELEAVGSDDALKELASLRAFEADQARRDQDRDAALSLERQRVEVRTRELTEEKTKLEGELSVARREIADLKARGGRKR